jgi:hypothetical protein
MKRRNFVQISVLAGVSKLTTGLLKSNSASARTTNVDNGKPFNLNCR